MPTPAAAPDFAAEPHLLAEDGIIFRRVETLEEYQECMTVQEEIWGERFRELVPSAVLMVAQKMGGVVAGAFASDGRMLGFVFGMTGLRHGVIAHWSDMLAVRREARGRHIGERLKAYQRELCLAIGVHTMYWTFDPLVARNAHLNLVRLGARAAEYAVNLYGSNTGSPLHGVLDTDRWIVAWDLLTAVPAVPAPSSVAAPFVVRPLEGGARPGVEPFPADGAVRVAIPPDHELLTHDERVAWRLATRAALTYYLARGYTVQRFQRATAELPPYYELAPA